MFIKFLHPLTLPSPDKLPKRVATVKCNAHQPDARNPVNELNAANAATSGTESYPAINYKNSYVDHSIYNKDPIGIATLRNEPQF